MQMPAPAYNCVALSPPPLKKLQLVWPFTYSRNGTAPYLALKSCSSQVIVATSAANGSVLMGPVLLSTFFAGRASTSYISLGSCAALLWLASMHCNALLAKRDSYLGPHCSCYAACLIVPLHVQATMTHQIQAASS